MGDNETFMDGLLLMSSKLSPGEVAKLMRNSALVSRLSPQYACSILNITRHLDSHGLDGAKTLKSLIGETPLGGKVAELEVKLVAMMTRNELEAFLKLFRGSYKHKCEMAAAITDGFLLNYRNDRAEEAANAARARRGRGFLAWR